MLPLLCAVAAAATTVVFGVGRPHQPGVPHTVKLIIDTDLGSDVSNLISVCSANAMVDRGEVDLAKCDMRHATYDLRHATCNMQHR